MWKLRLSERLVLSYTARTETTSSYPAIACAHRHAHLVHVWRSQDNLWDSIFCFYVMGLRD